MAGQVKDRPALSVEPERCAAVFILLLVGFAAATGQIVILREVIALFNGNELSLGIVLAAWLAWTAAGSWLTGRLTRSCVDVRNRVATVECLCGLSLPLTVVALRESRAMLQSVPGELLDPARTALICFVCMSIFCVLSGSVFSLAAQMLRQTQKASSRRAGSYAYMLETAGSSIGGIVAGILLTRFLSNVQIAVLVALICCLVGGILFFSIRIAPTMTMMAVAAVFAIPLLMRIAPWVEITSLKRMWSGFELLGFRDSIYGRLTVLGAGGMRSIYDNGSILANLPDPSAAEESVHYALLEHPEPKTVLLIGAGINGSLAEALKHPSLERLDYVEIDPALIDLMHRLFPLEFTAAFSDRRVHLHEMDGRLFLQTSPVQFDAILANVPDPANAQLNRFYTVEFFRLARAHLAPGGVLALQVRASEDYISPEEAEFLRCLDRSLQQVFPHVSVIPGESFHLFASMDPKVLTEDPQVLISRLKSRGLQTLYVREYFVPFRMMPDRMARIHNLLQPQPGTPVNKDFRPAAYYFNTVLWSAQFNRGYARLLETAEHIRYRSVLCTATATCFAVVLIFGWVWPLKRRAQAACVLCVTASGYTLMILQILLLLAFQSVFGYVYHELALLIGMFMAGIAIGSLLGILRASHRNRKALMRWTAINQLLLAASAPLLLVVVFLLAQYFHAAGALAAARIAFPCLALLVAVPGGYQFPLASVIYFSRSSKGKNLAVLYSVDLLGGCIGALLLSGFLIPLYGFWNVATITAVVNIAVAALAARACGGLAVANLHAAACVRERPAR